MKTSMNKSKMWGVSKWTLSYKWSCIISPAWRLSQCHLPIIDTYLRSWVCHDFIFRKYSGAHTQSAITKPIHIAVFTAILAGGPRSWLDHDSGGTMTVCKPLENVSWKLLLTCQTPGNSAREPKQLRVMETILPFLFVSAALGAPALPNARQLEFMELEISQFMHFGINTAWQPPDSFLRDTPTPPGPTYHKCVQIVCGVCVKFCFDLRLLSFQIVSTLRMQILNGKLYL